MSETSITSGTTITPVTRSVTTPEQVLPDLEVTSVNKQILDPDFTNALPGGEAYVVNRNSQVMKLNNTGHTVKMLYDCNLCDDIGGLFLLGSYLYVVHGNGTTLEIQPHTGQLHKTYNIPNVTSVGNNAPLWSDPSEIPHTDIVHLIDYREKNVFSYNLTSGVKQVHVSGLNGPTSVSYSISDDSIYYIVCEMSNHKIHVYNSSWGRVNSFGGYGTGDGDLRYPTAAIGFSNNSIIVSGSRISVFTRNGDFLYHLLIDLIDLESLSYFRPYLWIEHNMGFGLYRSTLDQ